MSKETIKKLEKIRGHFINTSKGCVLANATNDMIAEWLDEVIAALKAEPKVNLWFVRDYLKSALNRWDIDAKYWVEQALCELEPCETCGGEKVIIDEKKGQQITSGGVTLSNLIPCPDCGYKQIELMGGKYAIVDIGDFERVNKYKWRLDENGRATRNMWDKGKQRNIKMHRFIMDAPEGMCVDHINYDTLDNRKSNLRICTPSQSSAHRKAFPNTSSKYKGVSKRSNCNKWQAHIKQNYKGMYLGDYDTEEEAARVYDKKAKELFGEYAELNFPPDCQQPKAEGDNRRLEVLRFNRNELFQETIKLKAELASAKERIEGLTETEIGKALDNLNSGQISIIKDGIEQYGHIGKFGKRFIAKVIIEQALKAEQKGTDDD